MKIGFSLKWLLIGLTVAYAALAACIGRGRTRELSFAYALFAQALTETQSLKRREAFYERLDALEGTTNAVGIAAAGPLGMLLVSGVSRRRELDPHAQPGQASDPEPPAHPLDAAGEPPRARPA